MEEKLRRWRREQQAAKIPRPTTASVKLASSLSENAPGVPKAAKKPVRQQPRSYLGQLDRNAISLEAVAQTHAAVKEIKAQARSAAGPLSADASGKPASSAALLKYQVGQLTALVRSLEAELSAERCARSEIAAQLAVRDTEVASLEREIEDLNQKVAYYGAPVVVRKPETPGTPARPVVVFDEAENLKTEIQMVVRDAEALRVECMGLQALVSAKNTRLNDEAAAKSELQSKIEDQRREIRDCYELIEHYIKAIEEEKERAEMDLEILKNGIMERDGKIRERDLEVEQLREALADTLSENEKLHHALGA
ncbi:hypothetical protein HK101_005202 [Irineochytrium annulatum]|nr:hypothetical protein HK101_005202 [Irineochytrium annulatum]